MMMSDKTEIKQFATNLDRFHYIIKETGIRLIKKRISSSSDVFVEFEEVGSKIIKENSRKLIWLGLSVLFVCFAIGVFINRMNGGNVEKGAELIHIFVAAIFLVLFFLTRRNYIFLAQSDNSHAIAFIASRRYKEAVDKFIENLLQRRDSYLLSKYAQFDHLLPYNQQYNNLIWLYNMKILTKEQLKQKTDELDQFMTSTDGEQMREVNRVVGFRREQLDENADEI